MRQKQEVNCKTRVPQILTGRASGNISDLPLPLRPSGSKVISRKLSVDRLAEVESVLQRPPLIWDNLHANDYDSRRLFLGPFKGREPELRSHLRGLLLNPNCEFEANYIPLHSLGSWYRAGRDGDKGEGVRGGTATAINNPPKSLMDDHVIVL